MKFCAAVACFGAAVVIDIAESSSYGRSRGERAAKALYAVRVLLPWAVQTGASRKVPLKL